MSSDADPGSQSPPLHAMRVAHNLRIQEGAVEVLNEFAEAGIAAALIKGPVTEKFVYRPGERAYADADIWIQPDHYTAATDILSRLGFTPPWGYEVNNIPFHSLPWMRSDVTIDLHDRLFGATPPPLEVWRTLESSLTTLDLIGQRVPVIGVEATCMIIALHATQHGRSPGQHRDDLRVALERIPSQVWRAAANLAESLGAIQFFTAALQMEPEGRELAWLLKLPSVSALDALVISRGEGPVAVRLIEIWRQRGLANKAKLLWQHLFPRREYMELWSSKALITRRSLMRAYARRLLLVARRFPGAVTSLLTARQDTRRD